MQMIYKERTLSPNYGVTKPGDPRYDGYRYYDNLGVLSDETLINYFKSYANSLGWWSPSVTAYGNFSQRFGSTRRPRPTFNDCENIKQSFESLPYLWRAGGYVGFHDRANIPVNWYTDYGSVFSKALPNLDFLKKLARMRAACNMVPQFEPYVEMLNFLFELKDFRDIVGSAKKVFTPKSIKLTRDVSMELKRGKKGVPTVEPTSAGAGGWLFYQFALSPLCKDMSDIMDGLAETTSLAYKKYVEKGLKPTTMHYKEVLHEEPLLTRRSPAAPLYYLTDEYVSVNVVFNSTMDMTYDAPLVDPMEAFKQAWGLRFTPGVIWNGTKFTFLLDYFLKVGKALEQAERFKNKPPMRILQQCESVTVERVMGLRFNAGYGCWKLVLDGKIHELTKPVFLTKAFRTEYLRELSLPSHCMPLPKFSIPSVKQWYNMLALARVFL